ncbi:MAG TPA: hypothetical protein VN903_37785 [Polyangia bacterium]|jgi:hypothetical protein|nr:hypothetical protein [Polyangia bacterium]
MRRGLVGLVGLVILVSGIGSGCDGDDAPLMPAHSSSFLPVRGTADSGGPADRLQWVYRVNSGAPAPVAAIPGVTLRFSDEVITASGTTYTFAVNGTYASDSSVGLSGTQSLRGTDHLSADSPATVLSR